MAVYALLAQPGPGHHAVLAGGPGSEAGEPLHQYRDVMKPGVSPVNPAEESGEPSLLTVLAPAHRSAGVPEAVGQLTARQVCNEVADQDGGCRARLLSGYLPCSGALAGPGYLPQRGACADGSSKGASSNQVKAG